MPGRPCDSTSAAAASSPASPSGQQGDVEAPCSAKSTAVARPTPADAPVTRATFRVAMVLVSPFAPGSSSAGRTTRTVAALRGSVGRPGRGRRCTRAAGRGRRPGAGSPGAGVASMSNSSAKRPGVPHALRLRSNSARAARWSPCWFEARASRKPQRRKAPSASPSGRASWRSGRRSRRRTQLRLDGSDGGDACAGSDGGRARRMPGSSRAASIRGSPGSPLPSPVGVEAVRARRRPGWRRPVRSTGPTGSRALRAAMARSPDTQVRREWAQR